MLKEKITFVVPGLLLGVSVLAVPAPVKTDNKISPDYTVRRENAGRQEILRESDKKVAQANRAVLDGKYDAAIKIYNEVIGDLEKYSGETFKTRYDFCRQRVEHCYFQKAAEAMRKADDSVTIGDFEQAIKLCQEAIKYCPERKAELEKKVAFYEKRRTAAVSREKRNINVLAPELEGNNYKVDLLIEQGRNLARRQEYIKAKRAFSEVLLLDPYNDVAMQNLLAVNEAIKQAAKLRANATQRRFTAMDKWSGAIPVVLDEESPEGANQIAAPVEKVVVNDKIREKLETIIIPSVSFADQTFAEVMESLSNLCRRYDKARTGVNFVIKDSQAAIDNPDNAPRIPELMKRNTTILDILNDLQEKHHFLTYRIDRNAVYVAAAGIPLEKIEVRVFDISLPKKLIPKLKDHLAAYGIEWDDKIGTSISVKGNFVIARHTPDNLKKIEGLLQEISDDEPDMVQIMFKFLEVKQDDLDELAFNWQYSRGGSHHFGFNSNNSLLRHYYYNTESGGTRFSGGSAGGNQDDSNFFFNWSDRKNDFSFELYALDWADNTSILYAPRVTTLSGHKAEIDMSEKHYYADEWESIDGEITDDFRFAGAVQPDFEMEKSLGVSFSVQPEVSGNRIKVPINIPITQFKEWLIFDSNPNPDPGGDEDDREYIKKPVFSFRKIETEVTVKDGETVFVGGVVTDMSTVVHDKVPILGDIPFIGRFFQSKYTKSEKVNLMVFVTCRIIKPDGSVRYPHNVVNEGLPPIPRNQ